MQSSDHASRLNAIVNQTDTRAGKAFDLAVQGLIIVSLISFLHRDTSKSVKQHSGTA